MADMPRHYDVWADYDDGLSEPLLPSYVADRENEAHARTDYVCGLREAIRQARNKWGDGHRIELCRYSRHGRRNVIRLDEIKDAVVR